MESAKWLTGGTIYISDARVKTDKDSIRYLKITPVCEVRTVGRERESNSDDNPLSTGATVRERRLLYRPSNCIR